MPARFVKRRVLRRGQHLDGGVGALLQLLGREHAGEQVDRLDAGEDPRSRLLDLGQLVAEEHEERLDDHVGALEDVDGRLVAGQRRLADRPDADLTGGGRRGVRQAEVHDLRAEALAGGHEGVDVLDPFLALREEDEALALPQLAEPQHALAQVGEHRLAERRSPSVSPSLVWL